MNFRKMGHTVRNTGGQALVIAIFIVAILAAGAVAFSEMVSTDLKAARTDLDNFNRLLALKSGLRYAMALLENHTSGPDTLKDDWARLGGEGDWTPVGDASFRAQIVDASSLLNLNTATSDSLKALGLEGDIVDAIIDWRDKDSNPFPQGTESEYYESLPVPYTAKNGPFDTVEELLLVKGMTPELLYSSIGLRNTLDTAERLPLIEMLTARSGEENVTVDGKPRINISTATAQEMEEKSEGAISHEVASAIEKYRKEQGSFKTLADLFKVSDIPAEAARKIIDLVTLSDAKILEGRININTVSPEVLKAVLQLSDEALQAVLNRRESAPFETLGDVEEILQAKQSARQTGDSQNQPAPTGTDYTDKVATKSAYFMIRLLARVEGKKSIRGAWALAKKNQGKVKILQWCEVDRSPGWSQWRWESPERRIIP